MKGKTAYEQGESKMSNNDWVQADTPREDEWADEQNDYGVPVSPVEWDDYAAEQSVPVPQPAAADPEEPPVDEPLVEPGRDVGAPVSKPMDSAQDAEEEPEALTEELGEPVAEEPLGEPGGEEPLVEAVGEEPLVEPGRDAGAPVSKPMDSSQDAEEEPVPDYSGFGRPIDTAPFSDENVDVEQTAEVVTVIEDEPAGDEPLAGEETAALPAAALAATPVLATAPAALSGLYREDGELAPTIDQTQRIDLAEEAAEEQRIADQLRAEKEARDQRLGLVATSDANAVRAATPLPRPGVGRFASFGLLVLRLITAGILGIIGYQILSNVDASADLLGRTLLPEPRLLSWIFGFSLAALAVLLVIGLAVRVVGLLMTVLAVGALAFLRWGAFSVFRPGVDGFIGDRDLLLAGVGILFFCVGGGRAGVDAAFSIARWRAKEAKRS